MEATTVYMNSSENTTIPEDMHEGLFLAYNITLAMIVVVVMFSMGTTITIDDLKTILRRPVGPLIGFTCQCLILPAACFGYALLLDLDDNLALGMVVAGACPGGSISNIVTYWTRADVSLSVAMTTISTTLAIGFLPLNMFIYSRAWVDDPTALPYVNMVITVLYTWVAVALGFLVGQKWPKSGKYFSKIGSIAALLLILLAAIIQGILYPELFDLPWTAWFGGFTMPLIGFGIGFILAAIFCMGMPQRLAIGYETGIQNTALALTIIAVSFENQYDASYYSQFVLLYSTFQVVLGIAASIFAMIYFYARYRENPCTPREETDIDLDSSSTTSVIGNKNGGLTLVSVGKVESNSCVLSETYTTSPDGFILSETYNNPDGFILSETLTEPPVEQYNSCHCNN